MPCLSPKVSDEKSTGIPCYPRMSMVRHERGGRNKMKRKLVFDSGPTHYANPIPSDPFIRFVDYCITLRLPPCREKDTRIAAIERAAEGGKQ